MVSAIFAILMGLVFADELWGFVVDELDDEVDDE